MKLTPGHRKEIKCEKCQKIWAEKRQAKDRQIVLTSRDKRLQYRSKDPLIKIERLDAGYNQVKCCPKCSFDSWTLEENKIVDSLKKLSRAKQRKVELMKYLTENIYNRLNAGSKVNIGDLFADIYLRFNEFGDFILGNKGEEVKIPNGQAVARIKYFVDDLDKQGHIEIVVSKLKW